MTLIFCIAGKSYGKKFYGGIGIHGKKKPQFHVAVTNVATEISPAEQV